MYNYLEKYEDNFNNKYEKELIDYEKYIKMFYSDYAKCPIDNKTNLEKKKEGNIITLHCKAKGKDWKIKLEKPIIYNLYIRKEELGNLYEDESISFKNKVREMVRDPLLKPEENKEIESNLKKLKKIEEEQKSLNSVFKKQQDYFDDIDKKKQELNKVCLENKIKRENIYKKLEGLDGEKKMKIKEIFINEKIPNEKRLSDISKSIGLTLEQTKNWLLWYESVYNYVEAVSKLNNLNDELKMHEKKFNIMNHKYVLVPPKII